MRPGTVEIALDGSPRRVVAGIEDSAPGVPADMQDQLFDRFFRVDGSRSRATGGSGLGLAICSNIAAGARRPHHRSGLGPGRGGIFIQLPREASRS